MMQMPNPDFRAELQNLLDACESFADPVIGHGVPWRTALDKARAALAAEQKRPTKDELESLLYYGYTTSTGHGERSDPIGFALAVLDRWGN